MLPSTLLHHVSNAATKFEVVTSNTLGGDTFTRNVMDAQTHIRWYEINIPFFLTKKAGITMLEFLR